MSVTGDTTNRLVAPPVPRSIWVIAWSMLASQLVLLADNGIRHQTDGAWLVVSAAFGGLVVGLVSAGVVRARTGPIVLAWVALLLKLVGEVAILAGVGGGGRSILTLLMLASTVVTLVALDRYSETAWYARLRAYPSTLPRTTYVRLVAVGVLVGVLAGVVGTGEPVFGIIVWSD